jgi:hypothetical protein
MKVQAITDSTSDIPEGMADKLGIRVVPIKVIARAVDPQAPFISETGRPYLEPHHIRRLSDGGPDHPDWVASLCPNCHRHGHYNNDKSIFNNDLAQAIRQKEISISSKV